MLAVAVPASNVIKETIIPALAASYSILMKNKYDNLSAFHRLTSIIAIKGGLDERVCYIIIIFSIQLLIINFNPILVNLEVQFIFLSKSDVFLWILKFLFEYLNSISLLTMFTVIMLNTV